MPAELPLNAVVTGTAAQSITALSTPAVTRVLISFFMNVFLPVTKIFYFIVACGAEKVNQPHGYLYEITKKHASFCAKDVLSGWGSGGCHLYISIVICRLTFFAKCDILNFEGIPETVGGLFLLPLLIGTDGR